ncbi:MAG: GGDEF domain-containing protein [Calditerrivibrio sp.]|uniref:GGDEF domain-containing protein n=1 Tax=Calditerrivibrio sp. TaxID=2792612 RepID=UPI003D137E0E
MIDHKIRHFQYKIAEVLYLFTFTIIIASIKFLESTNNKANYAIIIFFLIFIILKFSIDDNFFSSKILSYYLLFQSQNIFIAYINSSAYDILIFMSMIGLLLFSVILYDKKYLMVHIVVTGVLTYVYFTKFDPKEVFLFLISLPFIFITSLNFNKIYIILRNLITELSITDEMTGLLNQSGFMKKIEEEFYRSQRYQKTFSVLMIDSDNLKLINDTYGHKYGSMVIKSIAEVIKTNIRRTDFAARYGGDEFILCLVETDLDGAIEVAERIRKQFELKSFFTKDEKKFTITLSIGVSNYPKSGDSLMDVIELADKAMYQSKNSGKNKTSYLLKN